MELKPGYSQTAAGDLPRDWKSGPLGSVVERLDAGASVNSEKDETPDFETYPCVLKTGAAKGGSLNPHESKKVAVRDLPRLTVSLRKNTILISRMNTVELVGESGYVDRDFPNLFVPDRMWMATVGPNSRVLPRWLSYMLTWGPVKSQLSAAATGTSGSMKNISKPSFRRIEIPYPPVGEQQAIAGALTDADALIESLEQLLAKKRHLKQGAMQELLTGKKRLPGFTGDWTVRRLGDLAVIQRGASPRPIDSPVWFDDNSSVGWVRISDVTSCGMYLGGTTQRLSALGVWNSRPVTRGSVIMSICATVGRPVITAIDTCIHDGFVVFENLQADKRFLYYLLKSIEDDWARHGQTGSQMNLNTSLINGTSAGMPPTEEQEAIATVLYDMDAEGAAIETRLTKARQIKQGMMQELLTGRIRLV